MYNIPEILADAMVDALKELYQAELESDKIAVQETRKEFDGDYTIVVFPFLKISKKKLEVTAKDIGDFLCNTYPAIEQYNVVKGFLNLSFGNRFLMSQFNVIAFDDAYGKQAANGKKVVLEYCGPNTNKALHFGHVRNMMIGYATANILKMVGYEVHKVNILNDRGIAICKSMLTWQKYANGATPESTNTKGDLFVSDYYVKFAEVCKAQVAQLVAGGADKKEAEKKAPLNMEAREMLRKWEAGDEATMALWKRMNGWVYKGFDETFKRLGVDFEKNYYESETYELGKAIVADGLKSGLFFKKEDGSVWIDLTGDGLDEKILLRSDGTSVYLTQDLGTAQERYKDFKMDTSIYVVADEQNYHFKVLKLILQKMEKPYANGIYHLAYGMVELPGGAKMKSREGTKVDADDLLDEMILKAEEAGKELGKIEDLSKAEKSKLFHQIGLGAMKYFILKVHPKKRMIFDPKQSIELIGHTGPFIQYAYTRIQSLTKKTKELVINTDVTALETAEKNLIKLLDAYPAKIKLAATNYDPSEIANFAYDLAKNFNKFYAELPILKGVDDAVKNFRLRLSIKVGKVLLSSMLLLGIDLPERM